MTVVHALARVQNLLSSIKYRVYNLPPVTVKLSHNVVIRLLLNAVVFQGDQPSSGFKTRRSNSLVIIEAYRKYCPHLLHILHNFWHTWSPGNVLFSFGLKVNTDQACKKFFLHIYMMWTCNCLDMPLLSALLLDFILSFSLNFSNKIFLIHLLCRCSKEHSTIVMVPMFRTWRTCRIVAAKDHSIVGSIESTTLTISVRWVAD